VRKNRILRSELIQKNLVAFTGSLANTGLHNKTPLRIKLGVSTVQTVTDKIARFYIVIEIVIAFGAPLHFLLAVSYLGKGLKFRQLGVYILEVSDRRHPPPY
jgi:hypothetical protein